MFSPDKYYTNQELAQLSSIKQEAFQRSLRELNFFDTDTPYRECIEYVRYYSQNSSSNFDSIIDALDIDVVRVREPAFNPYSSPLALSSLSPYPYPPSDNDCFLAVFKNTCRKDVCVPYYFIHEGQVRAIIKFTIENYIYLKDHILNKGTWLMPENFRIGIDNYAIEDTMNCFIDDRFNFGQSLARSKLCFISKVFNKIEEILTKRYNIRCNDVTDIAERFFYRPDGMI